MIQSGRAWGHLHKFYKEQAADCPTQLNLHDWTAVLACRRSLPAGDSGTATIERTGGAAAGRHGAEAVP